jgi:hypothetical protein
MRPSLLLCRPAAAVAVAVLLLAGCGGSGDQEPTATSSAPSATPSEPDPSPSQDPEAAGFCEEVTSSLDQLTQTLETATEEEIGTRLPEVVTALEGVEAPPAIAGDWQSLVDGLDQLATTAASLDLSTPEGQQQYAEAQAGLSDQVAEAQGNVINYVISNCSTETVAPSS